ncbi:MAG: hypothetical protein ACTSWX_05010 [Promethearchaeota archaeon]
MDLLKTFLFGITTTGVIYRSFNPDSITKITVLGSPSYKISGNFARWLTLFALQMGILFFSYCLIIYLNTPKSLKKKSLSILIGGILFVIISLIIFIFRLTKIIPGIVYFSIALGSLITGLSFTFDPKLLEVIRISSDKNKVRIINRILPICPKCKKILDNEENWHNIEHYLLKSKNIRFSHGICPECEKKHYSDFMD